MLGRVDIQFSRKEFNVNYNRNLAKSKSSYSSLYDLFLKNYEKGCLVWTPTLEQCGEGYQREVSYIRDMRFDYVNGRIFIPIYIYKYKEVDDSYFKRNKELREKYGGNLVAYEQEMIVYELWNSKQGYLVDEVDILTETFTGCKIRKTLITHLPVRDTCVEEDISVLFDKYIRSSYIGEDFDVFDYKNSRYSYLSSTEKRMLKDNNLLWYSAYKDIEYSELRGYQYYELDKRFSRDRLDVFEPYRKRRADFESYILDHLYRGIYWTGAFKGSFNKLKTGKQFFVKYKEQGVSVFIKSNWVQNSMCA